MPMDWRAGVSSFGFTGTNAHVLIEEAPVRQAPVIEAAVDDVATESQASAETVSVLPLSARSPEALMALAQRYESWLTVNPDVDLADPAGACDSGA